VRVRLGLAILSGFLACAACTSLSDLSNGGDDAGTKDATSSDAPGGGDDGPNPGNDGGSDTSADVPGGPTNLIPNPGFEQAGGGCGAGWTTYGAVVTRVSNGHGGSASACQLCASPPGQPSMAITTTKIIDVKKGDSYSTEAWLLAGTPAASQTGVQLGFTPTGSTSTDYYQATFVNPSAGWTPSNGSYVVPNDGTLQLTVHVYQPMDGCVIIDDVGLYAAQ
jgi:hypothetical protein